MTRRNLIRIALTLRGRARDLALNFLLSIPMIVFFTMSVAPYSIVGLCLPRGNPVIGTQFSFLPDGGGRYLGAFVLFACVALALRRPTRLGIPLIVCYWCARGLDGYLVHNPLALWTNAMLIGIGIAEIVVAMPLRRLALDLLRIYDRETRGRDG